MIWQRCITKLRKRQQQSVWPCNVFDQEQEKSNWNQRIRCVCHTASSNIYFSMHFHVICTHYAASHRIQEILVQIHAVFLHCLSLEVAFCAYSNVFTFNKLVWFYNNRIYLMRTCYSFKFCHAECLWCTSRFNMNLYNIGVFRPYSGGISYNNSQWYTGSKSFNDQMWCIKFNYKYFT